MPGSQTRFERTLDQAKIDAQAAELKAGGLTYQQVADRQGCSVGVAHDRVRRALRDAVAEPAAEVRELELTRLDLMWRVAQTEMLRTHPTVNQGRLVRGEDGEPIPDAMPRLHAMDRMIRIMDRRSKLLGLDAPVRADVRVVDGVDAELERLAAELGDLRGGDLAGLDAAAEAGVGGGADPSPS